MSRKERRTILNIKTEYKYGGLIMKEKKWIQKNPSLTTIEQVIEENTGLSLNDLMNPKTTPYLKGLKECVEVTRDCISKNMPITIVGDYDCDGITSSSILYLGLKELTGKEPEVIIPKRFSEGYGVNMAIVDRIEKGLMITVDNGIAAVEQIAKAKEKGLTVVVIDHHIIRDDGKLPQADAMLDPSAIKGSEYESYCGAGLAYRFIMELNPNTSIKSKLVALAGIGTVADVMPLIGDNRQIVLESLNSVKNADVTFGLYNLMQSVGIPINPTATDYGFKLGPLFNASGRLNDDGGARVVDLLVKECVIGTYQMLDMEPICREEAEALCGINEDRKQLVFDTMNEVYAELKDKEIKAPLVYYKEGINEGIVGIIAGRLAEEYHMPVLVLTSTHKEGIIKGSGRSVPEVHLKNLLNNVSDLFIGWGGHAGAAGLSLNKSNLDELRNRLEELLKGVKLQAPDTVYYDLEIKESEIPEYAENLAKYEPFGEGCPKVRFLLKNFTASPKGSSHYVVMGKQKNHLKIHGNNLSLMGFDMVDAYEEKGFPMNMDVIGEISINYHNDKVDYQMEIIDFKVRKKETTQVFDDFKSMFSFC